MGFFDKLRERFLADGLSRNSTELYISKLRHLAKDPNPRNLHLLKDLESIKTEIGEKSVSTQVTYLAAIIAFLRGNKAFPKRLLNAYQSWMAELADTQRKREVNVKTEKQTENWMDWEDIIAKREEMEATFEKITSRATGKRLPVSEFQAVQNYAVLCLYTMVPPRRNADYQEMIIVNSLPKEQEKDMNYYVIDEGKFYFNNYKTSSHYGQQVVDVPSELEDVLEKYAKVIPGRDVKFMICKSDGGKLTYGNSVTRILNRVFGKNISSSMLRHIYLTSKYGDRLKEQEEDAEMMAHSVSEQREYIKHKTGDIGDDEGEEEEKPRGGSIKARLSNIRDERLILPEGMEDDE